MKRSGPMYAAASVVAIALALSNMPTPFYVRWQADIGFSSSVLTVLFSAYILGLLISLALSGALVSRFGSRHVMFPGLLIAMAASCLFAVARSEWALLIARAVSGLAVGACITAGIPWIIDMGGKTRRKLALSLASGAIAAGAGVGPMISGVASLIAKSPIFTTFLCEFVLLAAAVAYLVMLAKHHVAPGKPSTDFGLLPHFAPHEVTHVVQGVVCFGCALGTTAFLLSLGPSVLRDVEGADAPLIAGALASSMFLTGALVQLPGSRLSPRGMFVCAGAAIVLAAAAIALSIGLRASFPLVVSAFLAGTGYGMAQLAGLTVIANEIEQERRPQANALLNIGGYVPCGLLPVLTGVAVDRVGLAKGTLIFATLIAAVTIVATLLIVRKPVTEAD